MSWPYTGGCGQDRHSGLPIYTASNVITEPKDGANYQLTIDRNVQQEAETAIQQGVQNANAISAPLPS